VRLFLVAALVVSPQIAYAECADLTPLNQGQTAPCDGVHVKSAAMAKIVVDLEKARKQCDLQLDTQKKKSDAICTAELGKRDVEILTIKNIHELKEDMRKKQINFLVSQLDKSQKPGWYFVAGTVAGIAVTMASAWTLNQIK
jgi:hypothetical protein|tara:strand:- start:28 stop:453 length:426 start_codon:yes stop_codon:yes gene_type:complete